MKTKHSSQLDRLNRIEGQVRGIRRMIEEGRYCIEVATQIKAVRAALKRVALGVLDAHLKSCVAEAMASRDRRKIDEKTREVLALLEGWDG